MEPRLYNGLALAYIGDAAYELRVRKHVMEKGFTKVNGLHLESVKYTKGEAQAGIIRYLKNNNLLSLEELEIYKRGRNSSVPKIRKNISRIDYLEGTGFEALLGHLYLTSNIDRMNEIIDIALLFIDKEGDFNEKEKFE